MYVLVTIAASGGPPSDGGIAYFIVLPNKIEWLAHQEIEVETHNSKK